MSLCNCVTIVLCLFPKRICSVSFSFTYLTCKEFISSVNMKSVVIAEQSKCLYLYHHIVAIGYIVDITHSALLQVYVCASYYIVLP